MSSSVRERQQDHSGAETPVNRKYIRPCRYCGADFRTSRKDCYYCPTHRTNEARNEVMFRKRAQLSFLPEPAPQFKGKTYDPAKDENRLRKQLGRVWEVMSDGEWYTLAQLKLRCHVLKADGGWDSETGISARIRDLRDPEFGGYNTESRRVHKGLWEYRLHA